MNKTNYFYNNNQNFNSTKNSKTSLIYFNLETNLRHLTIDEYRTHLIIRQDGQNIFQPNTSKPVNHPSASFYPQVSKSNWTSEATHKDKESNDAYHNLVGVMNKNSKYTREKNFHIVNKVENQKRAVNEIQSFYLSNSDPLLTLESNKRSSISMSTASHAANTIEDDQFQSLNSETKSKLNNTQIYKLTGSTFYGGNPRINNLKQKYDSTLGHFYPKNTNTEFFHCTEPVMSEVDYLVRFYHNSTYPADYNSEEKEEVFSKYGITENVTKEEKKTIQTNLKDKPFLQLNTSKFDDQEQVIHYRKRFDSICKSMVWKNETFFENPVDSLSKIKANQQIFSSVMSILTKKQIKEYINKISEVKDIYDTKVKMKDIRINPQLNNIQIPDEANKGFNSERTVTLNSGSPAINRRDSIAQQKPPKSNTVSRETLLSDIELKSSVFSSNKLKPYARTQFTMTVNGSNLFIVGGVCNERLFEIWVSDCKNKFEWKQCFPKGENINPRMGHTAVLFQNMIYIFGGNVKDNPQMPRDDISIYDIGKN